MIKNFIFNCEAGNSVWRNQTKCLVCLFLFSTVTTIQTKVSSLQFQVQQYILMLIFLFSSFLKFIIFRIFLQCCQVKIVDYLFNCNMLRCEICLGCNFWVDSCCNAFFPISFWNIHTMYVFDKMSHSLLHWF